LLRNAWHYNTEIAGTKRTEVSRNKKLPMQSVFKYHLALTVLNQIDKGNFKLNQKISVSKKDLNNNLWSPIRKKYPEGIDLTLAEILNYTIAFSDNVGCDLLFRLIGGTKTVENYMHQIGVSDIAIEYDEFTQQNVWEWNV
jgi:beta-lactamase class A/beta-lactamase class A VEB